MEKAQGLEISMLCDRDTTKIAGGQAGFIQFVVMPIFQQLSQVAPSINDVQLANGFNNVERWNIRADAEKKQLEKEEKMKQLLQNANASNRDKEHEANDAKMIIIESTENESEPKNNASNTEK